MGATIRIDKVKLEANFFPLPKARKIALQQVEDTLTRTQAAVQSGKDAEGASLPAYSPGYQEAIRQERVIGRGGIRKGSVSPTNLTITGDFLSSRQSNETRTGAEGVFGPGVHYSGNSFAGLALKLDRLGFKLKRWHTFGKKDIKRIGKVFEREIGKSWAKAIKIQRA